MEPAASLTVALVPAKGFAGIRSNHETFLTLYDRCSERCPIAFIRSSFAEMVKYKADLTAKAEVPATDSMATGASDISYDTVTKQLTWTITYKDLSGEATAAHFHGPADVGKNAKPVVPIKPPLTSTIAGEGTLTDSQAADLESGNWYFNCPVVRTFGSVWIAD
jgi:hypothetical protein